MLKIALSGTSDSVKQKQKKKKQNKCRSECLGDESGSLKNAKKKEKKEKESRARPTGSREMNKNWVVRSLAEWTNDPALLYISTDTKKP